MKGRSSIYFIIPSMAGGGAEKVLAIILNYINRDRFDPKLVLFKRSGAYINDIPSDIEVFDLDKRKKLDVFKLIFRLRRIIKERRPDILVSFLDYANVITILAALSLKKKPKIILSERSYHRMYLPHTRLKFMRRILMHYSYNKASKIIAIAKGIKDALIEDFKVDSSKVVVIYNPIDIKKIRAFREYRLAHKFFETKSGRPVIISAGRLEREKGFDLLINAFAAVRRTLPANLIILGEGRLRDDLKKRAEQLKVGDFVEFAGFQDNPYKWMARSDIFILSSRWEGFGNVIIEAMACGVPVVAVDCPVGPGEIIINGKNGILVRPNIANSLTQAILEMLTNDSLRNAIREEALRYVEKFDVINIIPQYERVFEDARQL